jgi:hypothetical protein
MYVRLSSLTGAQCDLAMRKGKFILIERQGQTDAEGDCFTKAMNSSATGYASAFQDSRKTIGTGIASGTHPTIRS